jgi:hypothetical protein
MGIDGTDEDGIPDAGTEWTLERFGSEVKGVGRVAPAAWCRLEVPAQMKFSAIGDSPPSFPTAN